MYLRNQVIVPNDVRVRKGLAPRPGGDDPVILKPEQQSEQVSQATKSRSRDQKRQMNAPDKQGEARNPKGDGRKV